jgi:hypothetical protein
VALNEFKVTNPNAADPKAAVRMIHTLEPFRIVVRLQITGGFAQYLTDDNWTTNFYADSLGVDVLGELNWTVVGPLPRDMSTTDIYEISLLIPNGLATQGIYEFGFVTRLPSSGAHVFVEGYHLEIAAP